MIKIHAFAAERPPADKAATVASVPYDVVTRDQARALAKDNPESFLHVVRPDIDLADDTDPYANAVYDQGRAALADFRARGLLVQDDSPGIYLYRQSWEDQTTRDLPNRVQTGVVCCLDAEQYRSGAIKKHEFTRPDKEDDRTRILEATEAHIEPVFLAFRDEAAITDLIEQDTTDAPEASFIDEDKVTHAVWRVKDPQPYIDAFEKLDALYIADGHHRSAAAERAATSCKEHDENHTGDEEYNRLLAVCFPTSELCIQPYNRYILGMSLLQQSKFMDQMREVLDVDYASEPYPYEPGEFCVYADGEWSIVRFDLERVDTADPVASLDCALLQSQVLEPFFGIADQRTDSRLQFFGGQHFIETYEDKVEDEGVIFSPFPTTMDQLLAVADAGRTMPPKSTWFVPKLKSGLFVHRFAGSPSCVS